MRSLVLRRALALAASLLVLLPSAAFATVQTDQADYSPGSVVTVSGDNSNDAGYAAGEAVDVVVSGPNGYAASCTGLADANGAWACQLTLWDSALAVGAYAYTATGRTSHVSESGTFTDALQTATTVTSSLNPSNQGQSVTFTATVKSGNPATTPVTAGQVKFGTGSNCGGDFTELQGAQDVNASGEVTYATSSLAAGSTTIRACYLGSGSGASALQVSNGTVTQVVNAPVAAATTLTVAPASGTFAGTTSLTATLAVTSGGAAVAGKTVSFAINGSAAGSGTTNASGVATVSAASLTGIGAGTYPGAVTAAFAGDSGYGASTGAATLTVGKAGSTVAISCPASVAYDGTARTPCTASASGTGMTTIDLTGSIAYSNNTNAGTASASVTWTGDANHAGGSDAATFTVSKVNADCSSIAGFSGPYDGAAHGASGACTDLNGNAIAGLNLGATFTDVPGGTASWTFTSADGNYNDASGSVSIVISKIAADCSSITGYTGTYDGNAHGASGTCKDLNGNAIVGLDLGTTFTDVPGGTASWTFTSANGNYTDTSGSVAITISKANPTCAISGATVTYDGTAHGATGNCTGVGGASDVLAGLTLGAQYTNVPGGTAAWTFTDTTGNYNDASGSVSITINKANPSCAVSGVTVTYDRSAHGATGTCTGVGGASDVLAGLDLGASFTDVPGGTANWTFMDVTGNYNDASGSVGIVIQQKAVTGTFTVANKTWDGDTTATILTRGLAGVISPDDCSLAGGTTAFPSSGVGTYTLTLAGAGLSGADCGNYTLSAAPTISASITAWDALGHGFYQPIAADSSVFTAAPALAPNSLGARPWNLLKGGQTVPLKFNVYAGAVEKTSLADISAFNQARLGSCDASATGDDAVDAVTTGGTSLRYDSTAKQWIQNWKTPKVGGLECWRVWVTFADGSSLEAFFKLTK